VSSIVERFGPEIDRLKGLALGTLFGVTRDVVAKAVPGSIKEEVSSVFNDITEKAGGKPIQGAVLDESSEVSSEYSQRSSNAEQFQEGNKGR
jgi:hypothetical protein